MKFLSVTVVLSQLLALTSRATASPPPQHLPKSALEFRQKHPYKSPKPGVGTRHVVTIRPSRNDTDDVSADFKAGLERANHGGTLYLPANQTFVIGQPLDLTFLDDVHVHLDGEILFTDDTSYWQSVAFTHPFQNTSEAEVSHVHNPGYYYPRDKKKKANPTTRQSCSGNGVETKPKSTARAC